MTFALFLATVAAASGVMLWSRQTRIAQLNRLDALVSVDAPEKDEEGRDPATTAERYLPRAIYRNLRLLGFDPTSQQLGSIALWFALFVVLFAVFVGPLPAVALVGVVLLLAAIAINVLANRKISELSALMPSFFDRVRQLLVIGNSLPTAFARAVAGAQPQLITFFAPTIRRIGNGAGFAESIRQSADDIGIYEMHLFATAVSTNMRFGGSLTHALGNLIAYLRKRSSIDRELRANTSQIRFSAWVLAALPLLVAALIISQNKEYASWFITDSTGHWLLAYCIVSQVLGILVMRAITKTEF